MTSSRATVTAHPLCWPAGWPRTPALARKYTPGAMKGLTFTRARERLAVELDRLKATDVILSTNIPLRIDGNPMGIYREPTDPGVAVYFTLRGRELSMARDAYNKTDANLNSLALAIEFLRGLERHGGATMMERAFTGFAALPDPATRTWRQVLQWDDVTMTLNNEQLMAQFRDLAFTRHPDHGGSNEMMAELNKALAEARKEMGS